jgi:hypothetical protein
LVFSHKHNSLNKEKLLENPQLTRTVPSRFKVDDFIKDPVLKQFYMYDMNNVLEGYEPGRPENKPKLLEQMKKMEDERTKRMEDHYKMLEAQQKILSGCCNHTNNHNHNHNHVNKDIETLRNEYEKKISDKNLLINELLKKVKEITIELNEYKTGKIVLK